MRPFHAGGVALALAALCFAGDAQSQDAQPPEAQSPGAQQPALFPLPPPGAYPVSQTVANDSSWYSSEPSPVEASPSDLPTPSDKLPQQSPVQADDYQAAMQGGWDSCTGGVPSACGVGGPRHYLFANGLAMTRLHSGGFATSTDGVDPALEFDSNSFGNNWHGGFEIGGGWCFGCSGNRGLEVVYWGLYPSSSEQTATGTLDSLIDLTDIDYDGGDGNAIFDGAAAHRLRFDYDLHNVELNLLGNYGGPLGCGRVGHCGTGCGERWGFGWLAGFRYIHYTENWLFSAELDDTTFDNDANQLNYDVDLQNNLFGFQMGAGFDYCITNSFQAYIIGKAGIYGNDILMQQSLSGTAGPATLNSGLNSGSEFDFDANDFDLALASQIDVGGRYAINQNWSLDFGWRVLALSGVAIAEDNVIQESFQIVDGDSPINTSSSVILHGGYAGLTYAW
jgi:hypothetical protein